MPCPTRFCPAVHDLNPPPSSKPKITWETAGEERRKERVRWKLSDTSIKAPSALLNCYLFSQATSFIQKLPKLKQNLKKEECTHESYNKHMDMQKIWSWNTGFWMSWNQVKIYFMQHQLHKRNQNNIKPFQKTFTLSIPIFLISSWTWLSLSLSLYIYIYIYMYTHIHTSNGIIGKAGGRKDNEGQETKGKQRQAHLLTSATVRMPYWINLPTVSWQIW